MNGVSQMPVPISASRHAGCQAQTGTASAVITVANAARTALGVRNQGGTDIWPKNGSATWGEAHSLCGAAHMVTTIAWHDGGYNSS